MLISSPSLMAVWACTAILLFYISSISFACMLGKSTDGVFFWPSLNVRFEKGGQKQFSWSGLNFWEISFRGQYLSLCHWLMQHQYQNGSKKQCVLPFVQFSSENAETEVAVDLSQNFIVHRVWREFLGSTLHTMADEGQKVPQNICQRNWPIENDTY